MASGFAAASAGDSATADDLLAAGDLGPCELVRGTLVMMSPAGFEHGVVTQRIATFLHQYVAARRLGVVTAAIRDDAARARATDKIAGWLAAGCLEVWSVDPGSRTVTVHTASHGSRLIGDADSFRSTGVPGLSVRLADLLPLPGNA